MTEVFKSVRPIAYVILLASILISYIFLKASGMNDPLTMYQTIFGGKPLSSPMLQSLFVMLIFLIQYVCIDYIVFYIDNSDTLSIRYGSKNNWLKALLKGTSALLSVFLILFYIVWVFLDLIWGSSKVIQSINLDTVGVLARIYLFCLIVVLAQIYLLLKQSKAGTFIIMGGISVLLAMTSHYQNFAFHILPQINHPTMTFMNVIANLSVILVLLVMIQRKSTKKELSFHED
ncbi:hypothetical protein [Paenibacillus rubinfantis]|uniref:hypothetical protein n=1 Tax=Paenibacillus rubinfantis TaxID=1720296 RepID=UPI00073F6573|nr:hypothetical protein [Paenibacillus rubinfantis]